MSIERCDSVLCFNKKDNQEILVYIKDNQQVLK